MTLQQLNLKLAPIQVVHAMTCGTCFTQDSH